jgi:hypothetical protein
MIPLPETRGDRSGRRQNRSPASRLQFHRTAGGCDAIVPAPASGACQPAILRSRWASRSLDCAAGAIEGRVFRPLRPADRGISQAALLKDKEIQISLLFPDTTSVLLQQPARVGPGVAFSVPLRTERIDISDNRIVFTNGRSARNVPAAFNGFRFFDWRTRSFRSEASQSRPSPTSPDSTHPTSASTAIRSS